MIGQSAFRWIGCLLQQTNDRKYANKGSNYYEQEDQGATCILLAHDVSQALRMRAQDDNPWEDQERSWKGCPYQHEGDGKGVAFRKEVNYESNDKWKVKPIVPVNLNEKVIVRRCGVQVKMFWVNQISN